MTISMTDRFGITQVVLLPFDFPKPTPGPLPVTNLHSLFHNTHKVTVFSALFFKLITIYIHLAITPEMFHNTIHLLSDL